MASLSALIRRANKIRKHAKSTSGMINDKNFIEWKRKATSYVAVNSPSRKNDFQGVKFNVIGHLEQKYKDAEFVKGMSDAIDILNSIKKEMSFFSKHSVALFAMIATILAAVLAVVVKEVYFPDKTKNETTDQMKPDPSQEGKTVKPE